MTHPVNMTHETLEEGARSRNKFQGQGTPTRHRNERISSEIPVTTPGAVATSIGGDMMIVKRTGCTPMDSAAAARAASIEAFEGVEENDASSDLDLKKDNSTDVLEELFCIDAPMREFSYAGGCFSKQPVAFNPLASFIGIAVLWGVSIW
jgi:hypothetical protein